LIVGLIAVNLLLANKTLPRRQLNARAETVNPAAQSLREGEVVASIAGTNLDGRPYELN
jgi:hypothetical protein